jgi:AcrR family transcriptional regulator
VNSGQAKPRRPRADARRNYERLLAEAESAFLAQGTDASLEAIARQAGVAIGTLYGHFPTRLALVSAVLRDRNDALFRLGDSLLAEPSERRALTDWMRAATRHAAAYRGLASMLASSAGNEGSELHEPCVRMADFTQKLTARAWDAAMIRLGVSEADVSALISAAAWTAERTSTKDADRLLALAFTGLQRPPGGIGDGAKRRSDENVAGKPGATLY